MRYQIYEAKSVKYDAQQRVGMNHKDRKSPLLGLAVSFVPEQIAAAVEADRQREQAEKGRKRPRRSLDRGGR